TARAAPLAAVLTPLPPAEPPPLAATAANPATAAHGAAVPARAQARRIDIYGGGASHLVAQDLGQKLLRIGLFAQAHA
ncbi:RpiR family transcriptional regulator, partial [Streptomyces sp. DT18]